MNVYTDGSKTDTGVRCGYAILSNGKLLADKCIPLGKECTVFQAELEAIHRSACYLNKNFNLISPKYIKIFSDNQSSLQALNATNITSKTALKTIMSLYSLGKRVKRLTLVWIKAHVGHPGNEMADDLAQRATRFCSPNNETPLAIISVKENLKIKIYDSWMTAWLSLIHI